MTRLKAEQLEASLRSSLSSIYIVSGDEPLLVQECCDHVRAAAKAAGFSEREVYHADHNFDWNHLYLASQSLSLFGDKRLIEIRLSGKLSDKGRAALQEYAGNAAPDTLLLIVMAKLERSTLNSKWFSTLEKASTLVQVWPVAGAQLPRWISQRAQRLGLQLNRDATELLASRVEGNLLAAAQELEKLALISNGKVANGQTIDATLISQAVTDSSRYDVYSLVDKCLQGNARDAVKTLNGLRAEGTEVIVVLWALTREVRNLLQISRALDHGKSLAAAAKSVGIWESRHGVVKTAMQHLKKNHLYLLLRKANRVDKAAKGMDSSDPWEGCLELVLNLAGVMPLSDSTERVALSI